MRPVVLYTLLSLDGVAESPDQFVLDWDDGLDDNLAEVIGTQDAVLLGRHMYDEWSVHWPPSDMQPFAPFINRVQKYVVTSSDPSRNWPPTTLVKQRAEDAVADLKQTDGGAIGVHGSITLARSLLRAGLIDELRLAVFPTTVGSGRLLFEGTERQRWELVASDTTPSGALLLHHRRLPV
jgi:dihydrofolate reductase